MWTNCPSEAGIVRCLPVPKDSSRLLDYLQRWKVTIIGQLWPLGHPSLCQCKILFPVMIGDIQSAQWSIRTHSQAPESVLLTRQRWQGCRPTEHWAWDQRPSQGSFSCLPSTYPSHGPRPHSSPFQHIFYPQPHPSLFFPKRPWEPLKSMPKSSVIENLPVLSFCQPPLPWDDIFAWTQSWAASWRRARFPT